MKIFIRKIREIGLSKVFFYTLILLIPLQTRKIFFTDQSFFFGYHSFYNTFYLYLTDIVFLGLILAWLWENLDLSSLANASVLRDRRERKLLHRIFTKIAQDVTYLSLFLFWLVSLVSLIFSREISLSVYGVVKLTEFIALFVFVRENINLSRERFIIFWLILATSSIQAIIGIWQYISQSSLGLRIFGEEFLRPGIRGIAEFVSHETVNQAFYGLFPYLRPVTDDLVINIRAYATFSHPNVLAGFLIVGLLANLYILHRRITFHRKIFHRNVENGEKSNLSRERLLNWFKTVVLSISLILISTGLIVTFSRFAWLVASILVAVWLSLLIFHSKKSQRTALAVVLLFLIVFAVNWFLFGTPIKDRVVGVDPVGVEVQDYSSSESVSQRQLFNKVALEMVQAKRFLGVGVNNFVVRMDDFSRERLLPFQHQPVHNIYLLIASEVGVIGAVVFVIFLYNIVRLAYAKASASLRLSSSAGRHGSGGIKKDRMLGYSLLIMVIGLLAVGLIDHYPWTIQQGSLLFWATLGLAAAGD